MCGLVTGKRKFSDGGLLIHYEELGLTMFVMGMMVDIKGRGRC